MTHVIDWTDDVEVLEGLWDEDYDTAEQLIEDQTAVITEFEETGAVAA